jgi:hypothetical protein
MFQFFDNPDNAINILKQDHDKVKDLFDRFETADRREKKKIAEETIHELKIHAAIEEGIFYPTVRGQVERDLMNEANEEHHVAKVLIAELERMDGTEEHFDAKYTVLSESIRHHIREEEGHMFPMAYDSDVDMEMLGRKMLAKKEKLIETGVPEFAEEKMVAMIKGEGDSPAKAAESYESAESRKRKHH